MTTSPTKFRREPAEQRKEALILATLDLVAERGVRGATVRAIAQRANVTQGLIRHYFLSKEDLISAAYVSHMRNMTNAVTSVRPPENADAKTRLATFVAAGLRPPIVDPRAIMLWASFLNKVREDAGMREIHEQTYCDFRDHLEALIADALSEENIATSSKDLRRLAIACNAVIDGLWMEGGALPAAFEPDELPEIAVRSVGAIIKIDFPTTEAQQ